MELLLVLMVIVVGVPIVLILMGFKIIGWLFENFAWFFGLLFVIAYLLIT